MRNSTGFILAIIALLSISCNGPFNRRVKGNGIIGKETRNPGSFTEVKVKGSPDIVLQQGSSYEVSIEADENLLQYIETRVSGNELIVEIENNINLSTHNNITVHVTAPRLNEVTVAGSGNITSDGKIENPARIKFSTMGSGDITAEVNTPDVDCSIAGSGNIMLSGDTKNQSISIAGNGDINNEELRSENTRIKIAGSGNARVHASVKLDINVAGSGDVFYRGGPSITQKVMGSGEVRKID